MVSINRNDIVIDLQKKSICLDLICKCFASLVDMEMLTVMTIKSGLQLFN